MLPFHPPTTVLTLAGEVERHGYTRFGVAEGWNYDAFVLLALVAAQTSRIEIATGVVSAWSRTPAAIAMAAAALQDVSQGRFALGIGASSRHLVEGLHGEPWHDPVGRLRRTVMTVIDLLEGKRSNPVPEGARPVRLGSPPDKRVPILMAALAPRSVRLAGELADAWMPYLWPLPELDVGRATLRDGEATAAEPKTTALRPAIPVAIAEDESSARSLAAAWLILYMTKMGPLYPAMVKDRFGYRKEVDALLEANPGDGPPTLPAKAERLAGDLTAMGTLDEAEALVDQWFERGADAVTLVLPPWLGMEPLREIVAAASTACGSRRS